MDGQTRALYPEAMKPEELRLYEDMYASIREALGTPWLVFEIGPARLEAGGPFDGCPEHNASQDPPAEATPARAPRLGVAPAP
jgi:hypothetical protein